MSSFAQRQLEKMGWKAGQGLGKDGSGVKTFLKVEKRATGLVAGIGHEAGKSGSRIDDMGFEGALKAFHKPHNKKAAKKASSDSDSEEEVATKKKASKRAREEEEDSSDEADDETDKKAKNSKKKATKKKVDSSSDDSSSSEGDGEFAGGIQDIDDADLFKRCGGVRLGSRTGRYRFFTAKQKRCDMPVIEESTTKKVSKKE